MKMKTILVICFPIVIMFGFVIKMLIHTNCKPKQINPNAKSRKDKYL
jgi:hypothetical protein